MAARMLVVGRDPVTTGRRACPSCGCMEPSVSWRHEGCDYHEAEVRCPQCGLVEPWTVVGPPEYAYPALAGAWGVDSGV